MPSMRPFALGSFLLGACSLFSATAPAAYGQLLPPVPVPPGNPITEAKVRLGQTLFWDEQLSSDGTVACGTCHLPEAGGSDPRAWLDADKARHPGLDGEFGTKDDRFGSPGIRRMDRVRNSMSDTTFGDNVQITHRRPRTNIGAAFFTSLFWDARANDTLVDPESGEEVLAWAAALEVQSLAPIMNDVEMAHEGRNWADVARTLLSATPLARSPEVPQGLADWIAGRSYPELFEEAFDSRDLSPTQVAMALASYQRTLIPSEAPILSSDPHLTNSELAGLRIFRRSGCAECHDHRRGLFTDQTFHFIGVAPVEADAGLAALTGDDSDKGLFLTPTLLNIELRGPYFHDGSKQTLEEVVEFYDKGGEFGSRRQREIAPLRLTAEDKRALLTFLRRPLTDPRVRSATGPFERPLLSTEKDGRYTAPVRGVSGAGGQALSMTAVVLEARAPQPFAAYQPASSPLLLDSRARRRSVFALPTDDLARMEFMLPNVVPDDPALVGEGFFADLHTLEANPRLRGTLVVAIENLLR
jgi:cytochrome c peroxidase